ncbi:PP2C family protein-serine/threonine phosphatase [Streptomyces sp. NPDC059786]|uniref:PP2C family protein-serine/threonine phosphatase n=1 Tax=Streptomyces sp. NPDC059786 TaxID=3346946 RepID=UPI003667B3B8
MCADRGRLLPMAEASLVLSVRACPAAGARLGGDLCEALRTAAGPRLIIGDVRGHGTAAAPLAAEVLGAARSLAVTEADPVRLARALDDRIAPVLGAEDFVTLLVADFRPHEVRLVNCGHPPPLRIARRLEQLLPPQISPPLGLGPDPCLQRVCFLPDQRLLLHTDGLTEARDPDGVFFPLDARARTALRAPTLDQALDDLLALLHAHTENASVADDLTLVLAQPTPVTGA